MIARHLLAVILVIIHVFSDDQPAAPPPAQRPTRDRKMPSRFEDYIMNITSDFKNYIVNQSLQQSFLDFPRGGDK